MRAVVIAAAIVVSFGAASIAAQDGDHMMSHAPDTRQVLDFPPPMRNHMLANMRAHLETVGDILAALSAGDGVKAGNISETRLGLGAPDSAACVKGEKAGGMAAMMAKHMPEDMRALGLAMHELASAFAEQAARI